MKRFLLSVFFAWMGCLAAFPARLSSEAQISLITCTPGNALYTKFGHTAIRVYDPVFRNDIVFNYGMFSFYADHFYVRFVKGETDYELGIDTMQEFRQEYDARGRLVYEQVLNLTQEEKEALLDALLVNYRPENRVYRYNFVYDNCATRPYYLIANNLHGSLDAPVFATRQDTYRDIIDYYTGRSSWAAFGINLIFGKDADQIMTTEQRMFLPEELMIFASEAMVNNDGNVKKLVGWEDTGAFDVPENRRFGWPAAAVLAAVVLTLLVSAWDLRRGKVAWWYDAVWFFVYGLLGVLMFFLSFVSLHPLVKHNFNLLFLNPLMFVPFALCLFAKGRAVLSRMRWIFAVYYGLALVVWLLSGQAKHLFIWLIAAHLLRMFLVWFPPQIVRNRFQIRTFAALPAILCLCPAAATAQTVQAPPRLLVTVVVDGLQRQNLERLHNYMGQGGLRTLMNEGTYFPYVYFPHAVNGGVETLATFCTGTTPYHHGIMEDYVFSQSDRAVRHSLADAEHSGIGTDDNLSPRNLLATTFADEVRLAYGKESKVYAVGVDAAETIVLAGHSANAVAWLDEKNLRWASTNFYAEGLPAYADEMNVNGRFMQVADREWTPRMNASLYLSPTEQELKHGFSYTPSKPQDSEGNTLLKKTPSANALVIELALHIQEQMRLGEDVHPDLLMLHLTTETPAAASDKMASAEQEDMYMRLNQDLGLLLDQLIKRVGKNQVLMVVMGKPHAGYGAATLNEYGISAGYFNTERSAALVNTYLMALYGHERWVDGCYDNHIYLNRLLIEQKNIDLETMQKQVANFLMEFEGVQTAYTVSQIRAMPPDAQNMGNKLQNSCHVRTCGDVMFTLLPGWVVADEQNRPIDRVQEANPTVPLFLWGANVGNLRDNDLVPATEFASYLCRRMLVPFPNAGMGQESISVRMHSR